FAGGAWNRDGIILFGSPTGLMKVSGEGGKPEAVTTVDAGEAGHLWPHFLPDGRHYLYTAWNTETAKRAIVEGTLGTKQKRRVLAAESNAEYAEPGYLLSYRQSTVYAQPFDWKSGALSGEPARVADEVGSSADHRGSFAVSLTGALVYFHSQSAVASGGAENQ